MASDNTLQALNDKLFAQLDRLDNRSLSGDSLKEELERTDAIIDIGNLAKVTRSQMARINQNHLRFDNAELTKVGITLAKLLEAKFKKE